MSDYSPPFTQYPAPEECSDVFMSRNTTLPPRPSEHWLRNPSWMDGSQDPPLMFYTQEEMARAAMYWGPRIIGPNYQLDQAMARISPTPVPNAQVGLIPGSGIEIPAQSGSTNARASETAAPVATNYTIRVVLLHPTRINATTGRPEKRQSTTKSVNMPAMSATREEVVNACIGAHGLGANYAAGEHAGPVMKVYWTGVGKTSAPSVNSDAEWAVVVASYQKKVEKSRSIPDMVIEICADKLRAYRKSDAPIPGMGANEDEELDPHAETEGLDAAQSTLISTAVQINGVFANHLKQQWKCQEHHNENGGPGACYVCPSGEHIRLNNLRLRAWAAAMASGTCTKFEPPSCEAFDGIQGAPAPVRARGRVGPNTAPVPEASKSTNNDLLALLQVLIPAIASNTRNGTIHPRTPSQVSHYISSPGGPVRNHRAGRGASSFNASDSSPLRPLRFYATPNSGGPRATSTPSASAFFTNTPSRNFNRDPSSTSASLPEFSLLPSHPQSHSFKSLPAPKGHELEFCLAALLDAKGIDLTREASNLACIDLTPDIIGDASDGLLMDVLGCSIGTAIKLRVFCRNWNAENMCRKRYHDAVTALTPPPSAK
ncbi:hypothetical protein FA15DRAFT_705466 [Coprinopsis marcescibilis]|uniref:Uncharacterized protein n=1 Tax=Coprinopsis marcescibilis TaxID=230819 RepID=A0A5C3KSC0_COPMA|nr:hypothetical protein FA15DRAFT_705466 [Coprinopsis marcescibilis]